MNLLVRKKYLSFDELCKRWTVTADDLHHLIMEKDVFPTIVTNKPLRVKGWESEEVGDHVRWGLETMVEDFGVVHQSVDNHLYLVDPYKWDAFHYQFSLACTEKEIKHPTSDSYIECWQTIYALPEPISMEEVALICAFQIEEVEEYERQAQFKVSESSPVYKAERDLSTKEWNTLLCIIAALCRESKIPYDKASKAASLIVSAAAQMGVSLGETTVEGYLKKIPDALASRMK